VEVRLHGDYSVIQSQPITQSLWIVIVTPSQVESRFDDLGGAVLPGSPADFGKLIADEIEKWGKVIRAANIKAE
jgi:hypothetical protein